MRNLASSSFDLHGERRVGKTAGLNNGYEAPDSRTSAVRGFFFLHSDFDMFPSGTPGERSAFPDIVVACVQMAPHVGRKHDNVGRGLAAIERAADQGAQLVVLPELCNTGYVFDSPEEAFSLAEDVRDGQTVQAWMDAARRRDLVLVAGLAERDGDRLYNSAAVIGPGGLIGHYRKLHLWNEEHLFFEPGDLGLPVFDTPLGRIAPLICYDGWFPETYRYLAQRGVDIVCMPTNWVPMPGQSDDERAMANTLAIANAHVSAVNIACADRVGTERGQRFIGRSLIVAAGGQVLAGPASADDEELLLARLNLASSRQASRFNAFNDALHDRRGDVYGTVHGDDWPPQCS